MKLSGHGDNPFDGKPLPQLNQPVAGINSLPYKFLGVRLMVGATSILADCVRFGAGAMVFALALG